MCSFAFASPLILSIYVIDSILVTSDYFYA